MDSTAGLSGPLQGAVGISLRGASHRGKVLILRSVFFGSGLTPSRIVVPHGDVGVGAAADVGVLAGDADLLDQEGV